MELSSSYGFWPLVIVNSAIFIVFAFSFTKPKTRLDWRSLGTFSAFIVALFVEMYGFPVTIYFLSGWLQSAYPQTDVFVHDNGHLWYTLLGLEGDPHMNPIHLLANLLVFAGLYVVYEAWRILHSAQRDGSLAMTGPYARVRHPQYSGFILVMIGFLLMWPTLLTLVMFPIIVVVYIRLARQEERVVRQEFGEDYDAYAFDMPMFIPDLKKMYFAATDGTV
jgi:protein-S-isoprenylcysteine O-methyltransferase Ste14